MMWRGHQKVQSTVQRWLLRGRRHTSADGYHILSSSRCLGGATFAASEESIPSLIRYCDSNQRISNPLLISCHAFSTRGGRGGRPRVPQMRDLHSVEEVITTAYEYLDVMSRRDVSAVWARIALLMTKRQPRQQLNSSNRGDLSTEDMRHMLYTIFDDTTDGIEDCGARELTETILGMAKIVKVLREQGEKRREDSSRVTLRELLLNKDMEPNEELFQFFANASMNTLDQFDARCLSNLAYAYALIDYVPEFDDEGDLFDHIAKQSIGRVREFEPQGYSNVVWAYATVKKPHPALFAAIGDQVIAFKDLNSFNTQNLKDTVWAFATAGVQHPKLFEKIANHIVGLDNLVRFEPQALSNTVWAYATAQVSHPKLFHKVAKAAIHRKEQFNNSQGVANLLWAYATMSIVDKQLFLSFVPTSVKLIDSYTNQGLANIAWAYAVADVDAPTLFNNHFSNRCVEKKGGFENENLSQLHQWHLWQTKEKSHDGLSIELQDKCYEVFISEEPTPSKLQDGVVAQLSSIGLEPKEEVLMDSGYRIDALVEVNGKTIGVEVDGPSHFIGRSRSPTGSTILKRRQVPAIDCIKLVSVPYWEWDELGKDEVKKQEYLRELLGSINNDE